MQTLSKNQIRDVAVILLQDAAQRGLTIGSQLPTERSFADALHLSRSAVRSALSLLEAEDVISREVGRGTYLKHDPLTAMVNLENDDSSLRSMLNDIGPSDVMAARQAFEPMAMFIAVVEATESDFEQIAKSVEACEHALDYDEFEIWDLAFHRGLIEATHNSLLLRMYSLIETARKGDLWGSMKRRGDSYDRRHHSYLQHVQIYEALRNRDGRGAQEAMTAHLEYVSNFLRENARG
ncbi:MAG: FadR family transcriptional regulator [Acidobacteriota bacterium]|nr:FadR family transcriptional regulator [Acidobacteriota bacterium]MDE3043582.1 FadR family transcriptional regulator [Acidobacteriota bacterium]MDE3107369.1 FadR family transcriptional regulator [Acidobacteriota bacterium]MDE3222588.1 FadR family transcriptional regulator [Acidobacteriota bacterium]